MLVLQVRRVEVGYRDVSTLFHQPSLFLASADSDFVTGQLLVVEGGGIMY